MPIFICVILLLIIPLQPLKSQISHNWNSDSSFYFFKAVDENLVPKKIVFKQNLTKKEILDSIAHYLTDLFFVPSNKYYKDKRKIMVNVGKVTSIEVINRTFYIATINIIDPDKVCMSTFFQGSTGGYNTYLSLVLNFIQPQLARSLLDGIIFTYNNEELKAMDHINLEGLISYREIDYLISKVIKN